MGLAAFNRMRRLKTKEEKERLEEQPKDPSEVKEDELIEALKGADEDDPAGTTETTD